MKVALYHRCSTSGQDESLAQHDLRTFARAHGMEIALEVTETGSGARNDRPGLKRVLDAARTRSISAVVVHKLDRFGRSVLDVLSNIRLLEELDVEFIATSQSMHIRPNGDAVSKLMLGVLASVAAFELDLIKSRTRLGQEKARRAGRKIGRPRKGNAPESARVATMRNEGLSWSQISSALGCTVAAARRALAMAAQPTACQNGPQIVASNVLEIARAA